MALTVTIALVLITQGTDRDHRFSVNHTQSTDRDHRFTVLITPKALTVTIASLLF